MVGKKLRSKASIEKNNSTYYNILKMKMKRGSDDVKNRAELESIYRKYAKNKGISIPDSRIYVEGEDNINIKDLPEQLDDMY